MIGMMDSRCNMTSCPFRVALTLVGSLMKFTAIINGELIESVGSISKWIWSMNDVSKAQDICHCRRNNTSYFITNNSS